MIRIFLLCFALLQTSIYGMDDSKIHQENEFKVSFDNLSALGLTIFARDSNYNSLGDCIQSDDKQSIQKLRTPQGRLINVRIGQKFYILFPDIKKISFPITVHFASIGKKKSLSNVLDENAFNQKTTKGFIELFERDNGQTVALDNEAQEAKMSGGKNIYKPLT